MKQSISFYNFADAFQALRPTNFSYEGLRAMFDHLEQREDDTGEEMELDVIALACDYTEYQDLKEYQDSYGEDFEDLESIADNTILIPIDDDSFIALNH
jgi:hypothetical protein